MEDVVRNLSSSLAAARGQLVELAEENRSLRTARLDLERTIDTLRRNEATALKSSPGITAGIGSPVISISYGDSQEVETASSAPQTTVTPAALKALAAAHALEERNLVEQMTTLRHSYQVEMSRMASRCADAESRASTAEELAAELKACRQEVAVARQAIAEVIQNSQVGPFIRPPLIRGD